MAVPHGRSDKRVTKEVMVELARPDDPRLKETAMAQNKSLFRENTEIGRVRSSGANTDMYAVRR
jgi:hypothetical protein